MRFPGIRLVEQTEQKFPRFESVFKIKKNKSAPNPRLKNSKRTSKCQFTVIENRKTKKWTKRSAGARKREPLALKKGDTSEIVNILSQLKGGPFGEKTNFRKKVSQCRKTERGETLGFFNIHSVAEHQKIEGGIILFAEKNLTVPKKTEWRDPLGFSKIHFVAKRQKNEGGTLWSRPVWYLTRENRKNLFGSVR